MPCGADPSLAPVYAEALRLHAEGFDHQHIADALDLTVEAVPALLVLARRKLERGGPGSPA
jgi:DNA-directed RNA polymerase specialized sigma24 family protein